MKKEVLYVTDVSGATEGILNLIQRNPHNNFIYFDGWRGFGATAVLRSIPQTLVSMKAPPPRLCFGRIIYIDCSAWKSKRVMQRKIAEELKLDRKTMAMFKEQDEEDDFSGVDHGSRDVIWEVSAKIDQTMRESRCMMVFLNGNNDEVALSEFGIPEYYCIVIWAFSRSFVTVYNVPWEKEKNLRRTGLFINSYGQPTEPDSQFNALLREEAATIVARYPFMRNMDLTMVIDCCCYRFFLRRSSHSTIGLGWAVHAPNFWICDGIIQEKDREISNALDSEISFEGEAFMLDRVSAIMMQHPETLHLVVEDEEDGKSIDKYGKRPYRWILVTSKNKIVQDNIQTILARASSVFLAFDRTINAPRLPNDLFKQCNKLGVLVLSGCAFSFVSPPFVHCDTLRFLGLSNCTHQNNTTELEGGDCVTEWTCLRSVLVLDLRYTDWGQILSEEKIGLMANLTELNIEGARSWQYTSKLQKSLPYIQRLRIIKPTNKKETSVDVNSSFLDKKRLEILDLSGNSDMKNLPASLSEASRLEVLVLDGCNKLKNVVLPNSLLRSFSFDGYGPASHWTSTGRLPPISSRPECPPVVDKKSVKTYKISLQGCTGLEDLFLRGLLHLVELDLSGCAIKVLDFGAMVTDVPRLKRLYLLGCERLRAIKWGSYEQQEKLQLKLICIDTRPAGSERVLGYARPRSLGAKQRSLQLHLHAVIVDARLARSLSTIADRGYFNISITSLAACSDGVVVQQPEAASSDEEMMIGSSDQGHHAVVAAGLYSDIFTKVGDDPNPMQAFPQAPVGQLDQHIEIGDGSCSVQSEVEADPTYNRDNLAYLMLFCTRSLHVHDVSTCSYTMPAHRFYDLRWCRVERCPNLPAVFPPGSEASNCPLETIWASDLLMARCVWSKGAMHYDYPRFESLRHVCLRRCPSLQFALAMGIPSFPSLETLHIIHCGDLRHVFVPGAERHRHTDVKFPKLTTIHLHDVPALRQICEAAEMLAPSLETIRIRGCWGLRRLPALKGREPGMRRPAVEVEKDVWDALEWDGMDAGHHPSLYGAPVHSGHYKKRHMLRGTVLR